jgi:hypothetical protein
MKALVAPEVSILEQFSMGERIECAGICHNGPIDDSPKAIRYAKDHDPEAPAAFLFICIGCDTQLPLCAKKVDSMLESGLLGSGYMKCNTCNDRILIDSAIVLPIL